MSRWQEVGPAIKALRRDWPVPGLAMCVVDADDTLFESFDGFADIASSRPVTSSTRFEIGSISKSFTGAVVGRLCEQGRLDLDAAVSSLLPWFSVRTRFPAMTVRHLLHHTSGLITGADALPDARAQGVALRDTETGSAPGEMFHYSNVGYALLGLIIERVTGRPLAEVVTEELLEPVGMLNSVARIAHTDYAELAVGYQALHSDRLLLPGDELIPATWLETAAADGNIASTASDMGRYARMLLGRGTIQGVEVMSPQCFATVTGDRAVGGEPSEFLSRYALGINTELIAGHTCLTHGGGMVGYASFLAVDLDCHLGVVVLSNAPGECVTVEALARRTLDLARTGDPTGLHNLPRRRSIAQAHEFVGRYSDGQTTIEVRGLDDDGLELVDAAGAGRLFDTGQGRFGCDHASWRTFPHRMVRTAHGRQWVSGPHQLHAAAEGADAAAVQPHLTLDAHQAAYVGHYRTYSPWYPSFRVVARDGRLHLVAAAGVEAHTDEPELVDLGDGCFRIGADPRLPERLRFGPVIDAVAVWADRDGCRYSRSFRD